jgi:hypothetical protein
MTKRKDRALANASRSAIMSTSVAGGGDQSMGASPSPPPKKSKHGSHRNYQGTEDSEMVDVEKEQTKITSRIVIVSIVAGSSFLLSDC